MVQVAVLGYGVVGSGVVELLQTNAASIEKRATKPIQVKYILDTRSFPNDPMKDKITTDFNDILNDETVSIVIEAMGGVEPAYTYVKKSLLQGKSCITSNKMLVAKHGTELLAIAAEKKINFMFEASVCGGVPIIHTLNNSVLPEGIKEIKGILNGTTNYILSQMTKHSKAFSEALSDAQSKGYAEKDPTNDTEGFDACRKLAIMLSLITDKQIDFEEIHTEGITKITQHDIAYAKKLGGFVKLLASAKISDGTIQARVTPAIVYESNIISTVNGVFNAVLIKGDECGDLLLYGRGAGKLPTASAVLSDIIDCAKYPNSNLVRGWHEEIYKIEPIENYTVRKLVRVSIKTDIKSTQEEIAKVFPDLEFVCLENITDEVAFLTGNTSEKEIDANVKLLSDKGIDIKGILRIER